MAKKIRTLIIDDSALMRQTLTRILHDDEIEVTGTASDPIFAIQKINLNPPDVITLDIEMPRMDGLTFLKKLMKQHPIPVVVISSYAREGSNTALKALEYGAVEVIQKPDITNDQVLNDYTIRVRDAVKAASASCLREHQKLININTSITPARIELKTYQLSRYSENIVLIGASTGGTEAVKNILTQLPDDFPAVLIVQHMPEIFTKSFADRLNSLCNMIVKEAENNEPLLQGKVLIANGNKHMLLRKNAHGYYVELTSGPLVNRHRPSVDVLFNSASLVAGKNATAIILTGMGKDGAEGITELKKKNVHTIAQDENSSVVFGMPKEAIKMGGIDKVLPLQSIAGYLMKTTYNPV